MIEMDDDLELPDLINMEILDKLQNSLHSLLGISTGVADLRGVALASHASWTDFCGGHIKKSKRGLAACENCDRQGMISAMEAKCAVTYTCHTGLTDFAVPIVIGGKTMGCFLGGQVATKPLTRAHVSMLARRYEIDPEELWKSSKKIRIIRPEKMEEVANYVYEIINIISNLAFQRFQLSRSNLAIERAANMKSDFLANMSHEIRTPMNAVIGMAEMALREELPPLAREYVNLIISSGKTLLTIINDILDFSKIESGKMDIIEEEYEPMSILHDITTMITTRIGDKDIELLIDLDPELPNKLYGDSIRIKQVIVNLANNAVKFTKEGKVEIRVSFHKTSAGSMELHIAVEDTGIGIKKAELEQLFQSFHQLDSKRNRNIEGTGLGLAISKRLVTLMHGSIRVESEYEAGSTFSFSLPQKIVEERPCISLREKGSVVWGLMANQYVCGQLGCDVRKLGDVFVEISSERELDHLDCSGVTHLFVEEKLFTDSVQHWLREHDAVIGVLIVDYYASAESDIPNLIVVRKPVYVLNVAMILNHDDLHNTLFEEEGGESLDFTAREANVLIVDDNKVNLTVAEGLLAPLEMQIDTALSGKEAVAMIAMKHYDLIFMDHMMPEIDGVETTRLIRRFHPEYDEVPIIALTANAVEGTKEMFLSEGMNDFVAKPIELRIITSKIRHWLPKEKIQKIMVRHEEKKETAEPLHIDSLDTAYALKLLGSEELYREVLKDYYEVIDKKSDLIRELEEGEDWKTYTIEVHALKSASRQIGAGELADLAAEMEAAGSRGDAERIHRDTEEMLSLYRQMKGILSPYVRTDEETVSKGAAGREVLLALFESMKEALEELDIDRMEEVAEELSQYEYEVEQSELLGQLCSAVEDLDVDRCEDVIFAWEALI